MPFGYSKKIFKYPPVQYIPLAIKKNKTGKLARPLDKTYFYIYDYQEQDKLHKKLDSLNIPVNYNLEKGEIGLLVINGKIDLIEYRGYEIIMVGEEPTGGYQIFSITDQYFYKDKLVFILYNGQTDERLDLKRYEPGSQ